MTSLGLSVVFMLVTHFSASTPARPWFVARWGEAAWMGVYSLVSFAAFGWMVAAWRAAPVTWLFTPTMGARHAAMGLDWLGVVFVVGSQVSPNAMAIGKQRAMSAAGEVGLLRVTRHPMLWGTALWSFAHMLANPDVASWWLFGGVAALSLLGMPLQDAKKRRDLPDTFPAYAARTSVVPFVAMARGLQPASPDAGMAVALVGGTALTGLLVAVHPWLAGVPVMSP